MWELQTVFERQNETPFGILWLGKQPGLDRGKRMLLKAIRIPVEIQH